MYSFSSQVNIPGESNSTYPKFCTHDGVDVLDTSTVTVAEKLGTLVDCVLDTASVEIKFWLDIISVDPVLIKPFVTGRDWFDKPLVELKLTGSPVNRVSTLDILCVVPVLSGPSDDFKLDVLSMTCVVAVLVSSVNENLEAVLSGTSVDACSVESVLTGTV